MEFNVIIKRILVALSVAIPTATFSAPDIADDVVKKLLQVKIRSVNSIALNPIIVDAVVAQNTQNLSEENIQRRDEEWRKSKNLTPLKYALQTNRAGKILKSYVDSNAAFNEAFLTDNRGANVAAYPATSDYWQGDEEKWSASFNNSNGKVYIGPIEKDESTNTEAVQISSPVLDTYGKTVGVLVMGINLSYLHDRLRKQQ